MAWILAIWGRAGIGGGVALAVIAMKQRLKMDLFKRMKILLIIGSHYFTA
jgi:hypothetical protein